MFGVVCDDDQGRFQMAVIVGVPDVPDFSTKQHVYMVYGMRAVSGDSDEIDQSKIATRIRDEHYPLMSAITHKTKAHLIPSIIKSGIRPGGAHVPPGAGNGTGGCMTSNFCAYLPTDPRNFA
eukprot:8812419-Heterocapsa_arctica.AAC.1